MVVVVQLSPVRRGWDRALLKGAIMRASTVIGLALTALLGTLTIAVAYADGPPPPPKETFTACASKNVGDACTARVHDQDERGTCTAFPSDGRLFCMPAHRGGLPPQVFEACSGKKESDTCSVAFGDHSVTGTCKAGPDGRLACIPPHR
jgi:hypothetical protein